jgi:hypothetical protein
MKNVMVDQHTMLATWQQHTYAEFVLKDAAAARATMTEKPLCAPLQRRVRDLRVAAQRFAAQPRNYVTAGAAVLARLSPASR